jgi:hypothetical protein
VVGTSGLFFRMPPPDMVELLFFLGIVFLISFMITVLNYLIQAPGAKPRDHIVPVFDPPAILPDDGMRNTTPETPQATPISVSRAEPRFADRLPLSIRAQPIIALQAEDHYLRVHTSQGSTLILLRLSDAVAELQADPAAPAGAQTHRSWWVAQSGVRAIARADGRAMLTLTNGIEAPVSRSHYKTLSARGWFR